MKNIQAAILIFLASISVTQVGAQVLNDQAVNYQVFLQNFCTQTNAEFLRDDWRFKAAFAPDVDMAETTLSFSANCIEYNFLGQYRPCYIDDDDPALFQEIAYGQNSANHRIDLNFMTWEEDPTPNNCEYDHPVDDYLSTINNCCVDVTDDNKLGITGRSSNDFTNYQGGIVNLKTSILWRYYNGVEDRPLNFGTMCNISGTTVSHTNESFRRTTPGADEGGPEYIHPTLNYENNEVYYTFTLNSSAKVTVSTDHLETDFNTKLKLRNAFGAVIGENDDIDISSNLKSKITISTLPAGEYTIIVGAVSEGGIFKLSVEVEPPLTPPGNNDKVNATAINPGAYISPKLAGATFSGIGDFPDKRDVWYTFTATNNVAQIKFFVDEIQPLWCLYDQNNEGSCFGLGQESNIFTDLEDGDTYFIKVMKVNEGECGEEDILFQLTIPDIPCSGPIIYVNQANSAAPVKDGSSWLNAFDDLQPALEKANTCLGYQEIWVAQGNYSPSIRFDYFQDGILEQRDETFYINSDVEIFGGFNGTESSLSARNWKQNETVLTTTDAYHIVYIQRSGSGDYDGCVLDGFTFMGGDESTRNGAGIHNERGSPKIRNCKFMDCKTTERGGAIYNFGGLATFSTSNPKILNCKFEGNIATEKGSDIMNNGGSGHCNALVENCLFLNRPSFTVILNSSYNGSCHLDLSNCTFYNVSTGVENVIEKRFGETGTGTCHSNISNTIFWMTFDDVENSISSTAAINYCIMESTTLPSGATGSNNYDFDPAFIDENAGLFQLHRYSPAVNGGSNEYVTTSTDLDGNSRIKHGIVDIGAYEMSSCASKNLVFDSQNNYNESHTVKTTGTITASNSLGQSANITYQGGEGVTLLAGFTTEPGAELLVNGDGCN